MTGNTGTEKSFSYLLSSLDGMQRERERGDNLSPREMIICQR